jgi:hypothetical protein
MALQYEAGEVPLPGPNRPLTHEAIFIPLRPIAEVGATLATAHESI